MRGALLNRQRLRFVTRQQPKTNQLARAGQSSEVPNGAKRAEMTLALLQTTDAEMKTAFRQQIAYLKRENAVLLEALHQ